jgi:hypothetical protein
VTQVAEPEPEAIEVLGIEILNQDKAALKL